MVYIAPSISDFRFTALHKYSFISSWGVNIQGFTKLNFYAGISNSFGVSYSTLSGSDNYYSYQDHGYRSSVSYSYTDGAYIDTSGTKTFTLKAVGTFGASSTQRVTTTFLSYSPPTITKLDVQRDVTDKTVPHITASWRINRIVSNGIDRNITERVTIAYKKRSDSSYSPEIDVTSSIVGDGANYSLTDYVPSGWSLNAENSYDFVIKVKDTLQSESSYYATTQTAYSFIDFKGDKGFSIGRSCEYDRFEVGFDTEFFCDDIFVTCNSAYASSADVIKLKPATPAARSDYISMFDFVYPVGSVYRSVDGTNSPASFIGGSWMRLEDDQTVHRWQRTA